MRLSERLTFLGALKGNYIVDIGTDVRDTVIFNSEEVAWRQLNQRVTVTLPQEGTYVVMHPAISIFNRMNDGAWSDELLLCETEEDARIQYDSIASAVNHARLLDHVEQTSPMHYTITGICVKYEKWPEELGDDLLCTYGFNFWLEQWRAGRRELMAELGGTASNAVINITKRFGEC